ncbi:ribonuclease H-like domain-containing protein [Tanacetum coccineum]
METLMLWSENKPDLDSMSFDDLYNNFKIVEQEVKITVTSSSNSGSQNVAFVSTPSSTNEVNTDNVQVSIANSTVSTDSTLDSIANWSDAINNPPYEDDLEEIDLKWQLALLSIRARKYYQITGKKITINGSDTAGYDKSKVECFNCHKMGHFAREWRGPRNQESRARNQDISRWTVNVEDISSKAMVAIDGVGFDWSYMADEEVPTNLALMAFSDSEVHNTCSNTCLKSFETLKTQLDNLRVEFNKSEFNLATYKKGLAYVEEQLVFYKKNEVMLCDQIVVLKRDASFKDSEINALNIQIEKFKNEKESNHIKMDKGNFVLHIVLTKSGIVPVSAARPINTVAPKSFVNAAKTRPNAFQKKQSDKYYWGNKGLMLLSPQHAGFGDLKLRQTQVSLELKGYLINNGYADLEKMLYDWS